MLLGMPVGLLVEFVALGLAHDGADSRDGDRLDARDFLGLN